VIKTRSVIIDEKCTLIFKISSKNIIITATCVLDCDKNENKIISINYSDRFKIELEKVIIIDKNPYKIFSIIKEDKEGKVYTLVLFKMTKSCIFIMPFLGKDRQHFKWDINFCNCYIGTEDDFTYGNSIYLLYRFIGDTWYTDFEQELRNSPYFIESQDVDKHHVLYEFSVPSDYIEDMDLILEGKYSQISIGAKNRVLTFHGSTSDKPIHGILSRSSEYREKLEKELGLDKDRIKIPLENELYDRFKEEEEIYLNKYKINVQ
jgi:hypothetical protein